MHEILRESKVGGCIRALACVVNTTILLHRRNPALEQLKSAGWAQRPSHGSTTPGVKLPKTSSMDIVIIQRNSTGCGFSFEVSRCQLKFWKIRGKPGGI